MTLAEAPEGSTWEGHELATGTGEGMGSDGTVRAGFTEEVGVGTR